MVRAFIPTILVVFVLAAFALALPVRYDLIAHKLSELIIHIHDFRENALASRSVELSYETRGLDDSDLEELVRRAPEWWKKLKEKVMGKKLGSEPLSQYRHSQYPEQPRKTERKERKEKKPKGPRDQQGEGSGQGGGY